MLKPLAGLQNDIGYKKLKIKLEDRSAMTSNAKQMNWFLLYKLLSNMAAMKHSNVGYLIQCKSILAKYLANNFILKHIDIIFWIHLVVSIFKINFTQIVIFNVASE